MSLHFIGRTCLPWLAFIQEHYRPVLYPLRISTARSYSNATLAKLRLYLLPTLPSADLRVAQAEVKEEL
jgi:hypothetical protein